jgi:hypothetical protein
VSEFFLTGGEPFLLTDIDEVVHACTVQLPTTLLTNGDALPRASARGAAPDGPSPARLQISLDSATADLHDGHRGKGSWVKAVSGIRIARAEGFRVRVAATLPLERTRELVPRATTTSWSPGRSSRWAGPSKTYAGSSPASVPTPTQPHSGFPAPESIMSGPPARELARKNATRGWLTRGPPPPRRG